MIGNEIHQFAKELWPINRSITGEGVRETFRKINQTILKKFSSNLKVSWFSYFFTYGSLIGIFFFNI